MVKIYKEKSLTKNPNLNDDEHLRFITCGSVDDGISKLVYLVSLPAGFDGSEPLRPLK